MLVAHLPSVKTEAQQRSDRLHSGRPSVAEGRPEPLRGPRRCQGRRVVGLPRRLSETSPGRRRRKAPLRSALNVNS